MGTDFAEMSSWTALTWKIVMKTEKKYCGDFIIKILYIETD